MATAASCAGVRRTASPNAGRPASTPVHPVQTAAHTVAATIPAPACMASVRASDPASSGAARQGYRADRQTNASTRQGGTTTARATAMPAPAFAADQATAPSVPITPQDAR